ncbi:MAG: hypothetical protein Q7V62_03290, partial [Actinomycetota bacterium]|nr:hypothetical protein [Actinomycetota bacterium]
NSLSLNLTARNATGQAIPLNPVTTDLDGKAITPSDSNPGTFDVPCKLVAGAPTKLVEITVNDGNAPSSDTQAPSTPGTVATVTTATSGSLSWAASTDNTGVVSYEIRKNGSFFAAVKGNKVSLPGLAAATSHTFEISAVDAAGNKSTPRSVTFSTPAESISTALTKYTAALNGTAQMKTLITGNLPLKGGITADMKTADGTITADLKLNNSTGRLNALGFLPVTAVVGFVSSGKTTGNLSTAGVLTTQTALRIKLIDVKLFGALSIAGGNSCQTKSLSNITLKSAANFDPIKGGDISGTFAISDLNNCGILTGIVSPLTAGGGNVIKATLTPQI